MPEYPYPGVYVEEVPPSSQPIAGVATSIAGFIGVIPDELYQLQFIKNEVIGEGDATKKEFDLKNYPVDTRLDTFNIRVNGEEQKGFTIEDDSTNKKAKVVFTTAPSDKATITANYIGSVTTLKVGEKPQIITKEEVGTGDGTKKEFELKNYPVDTKAAFEVQVSRTVITTGFTLTNNDTTEKAKITFTTAPANGATITITYRWLKVSQEVEKITSFAQFRELFGDLSYSDQKPGTAPTSENRRLIHAVLGFFNNGGTVCYVKRYNTNTALTSGISGALEEFSKIDEIGLVAVPGVTNTTVQNAVLDHCENLKDRFAVLDGVQTPSLVDKANIQGGTRDSTYGAIYFPWLKVSDPIQNPLTQGLFFKDPVIVPPSGHIVGVYARVDGERGVFKAPANEVIRGALDVEKPLNSADQGTLNPKGINVIRVFSSTVKIYGARTMGGDDNGAFKYISTRRTLNFLRESIDEGTQFAVFEPNNPDLWARISRNVGDFLLGQWRDGALFGPDPKKAFFVKCDFDTNPADVRERGQVITEIGVAIVKPAEFVIFRIQQLTGG
jgi:phage tail sheath protein FI